MCRFPTDYGAEDLAGQALLSSRLHVKAVEEQSCPELDDAFCRGTASIEGGIDQLRREVEDNMRRELADAIRQRVKKQVLDDCSRQIRSSYPSRSSILRSASAGRRRAPHGCEGSVAIAARRDIR